MIKYYGAQEALPGTHALPLTAGDTPILLTSLAVPAHSPGDIITIMALVGWEKPAGRDIGQIDLLLVRESQPPVVLAQLDANCFVRTDSLLDYQGPCHTEGSIIYSLHARSFDERALIRGPVRMTLTVEG